LTTKGAENGVGDGFGTLFLFLGAFWYDGCLYRCMNAEMHQSNTGRQTMNEKRFDNRKTYDNPIPKPPDELFDDFLRNMEERLVTRRFDVKARGTKQLNIRSESR
jgi:hypothetical protein